MKFKIFVFAWLLALSARQAWDLGFARTDSRDMRLAIKAIQLEKDNQKSNTESISMIISLMLVRCRECGGSGFRRLPDGTYAESDIRCRKCGGFGFREVGR